MKKLLLVILCICGVIFSNFAISAVCGGPEITQENLVEIVKQERFLNRGVASSPLKVKKYSVGMNTKKCEYTLTEHWGEAEKNVFRFNRYGKILNAPKVPLFCNAFIIDKNFYIKKVDDYRLKVAGVPPVISGRKIISVIRNECLVSVLEHVNPYASNRAYISFTMDIFGESVEHELLNKN